MTHRDLLLVARARRLASTGDAKRLRESSGLSVSEVAAAIGVSRTALWRWEAGQRAPRGAAASAWAAFLNELERQPA